jgi:hypothetical protein
MIAPFPQYVREETDIPLSFRLGDFISHTHGVSRIVALSKWLYVWLYRVILPRDIIHIIFAPFMTRHIERHFGKDTPIILLPHAYDREVYHP